MTVHRVSLQHSLGVLNVAVIFLQHNFRSKLFSKSPASLIGGMMSSLVRCGSGLFRSPLLPGARLFAGMPESQLEEVIRRLDALESRVNEALQQGQAWPAKGSTKGSNKQGPADKPQQDHDSTPDTMADKAADMMEDAAADAVQRLHPALIKFLNSGYLVSQQHLRSRLMQIEWDGSLRLWSQRKGLAEFEHWLADKGQQEGVTVDWSTLQELYKNPEDLSPLQDNPRARMLAHSMIQQAMLEKQLDTYRACTDTAKQLANVIESGQRTGVSTVLGALRKLLPIPFLK